MKELVAINQILNIFKKLKAINKENNNNKNKKKEKPKF